jgi:cbb3-type cytochrome oxidase subunit 1
MTGTRTAGTYDYGVVRAFSIMTVVWGIVGMLVGVIIAAQMAWPELNLGIPFLSFGRLRPLHTNAVIFAFGARRRPACLRPASRGSRSSAGNWSSCWRRSRCRSA